MSKIHIKYMTDEALATVKGQYRCYHGKTHRKSEKFLMAKRFFSRHTMGN